MKHRVKQVVVVKDAIYVVTEGGHLLIGSSFSTKRPWDRNDISWQEITPDIEVEKLDDRPAPSPTPPPKRKDFFNSLSFVAEDTFNGKKFALLADEQGRRIPGQCGIRIGDPDQWGTREVLVRFEVKADIPEGCETSINMV